MTPLNKHFLDTCFNNLDHMDHDRHTLNHCNWRSDVRSAMRAASQLPGRGPTDVDVAHVPACLSKIQ